MIMELVLQRGLMIDVATLLANSSDCKAIQLKSLLARRLRWIGCKLR